MFHFFLCSRSNFLRQIKYREERGKAGKEAVFAHKKEWLSLSLHLKGTGKEKTRVFTAGSGVGLRG